MHLATVLASADNGGNIFGLLLPFVFIGAIMYLLLIRPQRRRMREQADLQRSVGVGDEVVTTSGLFGFITGEDGPNRFWLEIDDNVQIRISRAAVQQKVDTTADDTSKDDDDTSNDGDAEIDEVAGDPADDLVDDGDVPTDDAP